MGRAPIEMNFNQKPKIAHFAKKRAHNNELKIIFLEEVVLQEEKKGRRLDLNEPIDIKLEAWLELPFNKF